VALSRSTLERAALLVDRSGLPAELETALTSTGPDGTPERRGRRRELSVRTLLIGIALAALDNRELHLVRAQHILNNLTWKQCQALDIGDAEAAGMKKLTARQVSYLWCRIIEIFDPSPHFSPDAAKSLDAWTPDEPAADEPAADEPAAESGEGTKVEKPLFDPERLDLLQGVLDRIVEASCSTPTSLAAAPAPYAVDWTYVESWARRRRAKLAVPRPGCLLHVHREQVQDRSPSTTSTATSSTLLSVPAASAGTGVPYLAERITITPATADPQPTSSTWSVTWLPKTASTL
jgi:hypothetical protein